jgi:hypothetical protein
MAVAYDGLTASHGLEISMRGEKIRDLGLDCLRKQGARRPLHTGIMGSTIAHSASVRSLG